jgi:hypothetical protein
MGHSTGVVVICFQISIFEPLETTGEKQEIDSHAL